jgi:hypothetical protein
MSLKICKPSTEVKLILAIDPGPEESAYVLWNECKLSYYEKCSNELMLKVVKAASIEKTLLVIEMVSSYGMAVGQEVFETCVWIGKFLQAFEGESQRITRQEVKYHICNATKAKDSNVKQAIIDRFGGKEKAIGTKKKQGPLFGITGSHIWSAIAVALTCWDRKIKGV